MNVSDYGHESASNLPIPSPRGRWLFRAESVGAALGFYLPATAATRAIGLIRGILLARLISETEYGLFQISLLVINILHPLCALGLNEGIARYVPMYETRGTLRRYLRQVVPCITAIALAGCLVLWVTAAPAGRFVFATIDATRSHAGATSASVEAAREWTQLMRIAAATVFATIEYFLLLSVLKGLRMFRAVSLTELLNNVVFTGLCVVIAVAGWKTATAMTECVAVAMGLVMAAFFLPLRKLVVDAPAPNAGRRPQPSDAPMLQLLRFSAWTAVAAVIWQALQYYPMWYLQKTQGPDSAAIFAAVRLVTQVVVVAAVAITAVVQTSVTKTWEAEGPAVADRRLALAYKSTALAMLIGCVAFAAAAEQIMWLFPQSYRVGVRIVPACLMFFLVSGHLMFLGIHFALIEKTRHLFWPWVLGLLANVGLSVALVSPQPARDVALSGAAWAGTLGLIAAILLAIALLRRERRPVDRGTVLLWAAIAVVVLPLWVQVVVVGGLVLAALTTTLVFSPDERADMSEYQARVRRRLRC